MDVLLNQMLFLNLWNKPVTSSLFLLMHVPLYVAGFKPTLTVDEEGPCVRPWGVLRSLRGLGGRWDAVLSSSSSLWWPLCLRLLASFWHQQLHLGLRTCDLSLPSWGSLTHPLLGSRWCCAPQFWLQHQSHLSSGGSIVRPSDTGSQPLLPYPLREGARWCSRHFPRPL